MRMSGVQSILFRVTWTISRRVRASSFSKMASSTSARVGAAGVGTRNPKSCPSLPRKVARRMKCSLFVAGSQTITADSSTMAISSPAYGAGAQASVTSARTMIAISIGNVEEQTFSVGRRTAEVVGDRVFRRNPSRFLRRPFAGDDLVDHVQTENVRGFGIAARRDLALRPIEQNAAIELRDEMELLGRDAVVDHLRKEVAVNRRPVVNDDLAGEDRPFPRSVAIPEQLRRSGFVRHAVLRQHLFGDVLLRRRPRIDDPFDLRGRDGEPPAILRLVLAFQLVHDSLNDGASSRG